MRRAPAKSDTARVTAKRASTIAIRLPRRSSTTRALASPEEAAPARNSGSAARASGTSSSSIPIQPASLLDDFVRIGQEGVLQRRTVRDRRIGRSDAHDGPVQIFEYALREGGGQLAGHTAGARVL